MDDGMDVDGLYLAVETTGLPNKIPGFEPRLIALGGAVVEGGVWQRSFAGLVTQPEEHLNHPMAQKAYEINGLTPQMVRDYGIERTVMDPWLLDTLGEGDARGFNVPFLNHFLPDVSWGACVMDEAAQRIRGERRIALKAAIDWALEEGFDVAPGGVHPDRRLRVELVATQVAKLAIAIRVAGLNA
jgi:hypothetical protein